MGRRRSGIRLRTWKTCKGIELNDADRLTQLPDALRSYIVSSLPTKEAVRTSILSSQWRYIPFSLSKLQFNEFLHPKANRLELTKGINRILCFHDETDIESFNIRLKDERKTVTSFDLNNWIDIVVQHKVRHFILGFGLNPKPQFFPLCFFTCPTLTVLGLCCAKIRLPTGIRFPMLKCLALSGVTFCDDDDNDDWDKIADRLFSQAALPVLEDLEITACKEIHSLCISSPSVKFLKLFTINFHRNFNLSIPSLREIIYIGTPLVICPLTLSSLVNALLEVSVTSRESIRNATTTLSGLRNIDKLFLKSSFIEFLSREDLSSFTRVPPTLPSSLRHLHLQVYRIKSQFQVIRSLICSLPQLQTLHLYTQDVQRYRLLNREYMGANVVHPDATWMLCQLQRVEFKFFRGTYFEMELVRHLFQGASTLVEMNISYSEKVKDDHKIKIAKKLLALPRASYHVTLIC